MTEDKQDSPEEEKQTAEQKDSAEEKAAPANNKIALLVIVVMLGAVGVGLYACVESIQQTNERAELENALIRASLNPTNVLIEDDARIYKSLKYETGIIETSVNLIRAYGYRCDSISAAIPFTYSTGLSIVCNGYRYRYEIEDRGGNWVVTLD